MWFDGSQGLVAWNEGVIRLLDGNLEVVASLPLPWKCHEFVGLPSTTGSHQLVLKGQRHAREEHDGDHAAQEVRAQLVEVLAEAEPALLGHGRPEST